MNLTDIKSNSIRQQVKLLKEKGNYLSTRIFEDYYIRLYTFKGLYFEVWSTSHLPWHDIAKIKIFDDFQRLEPYLPSAFFAENRYHAIHRGQLVI